MEKEEPAGKDVKGAQQSDGKGENTVGTASRSAGTGAGRDGKARQNADGGTAATDNEARSVVDASGSPSDGADDKQPKRKRSDNGNADTTAKKAKTESAAEAATTGAAANAADQGALKGNSRRSSRAATHPEKKQSSASTKVAKARPSVSNTNSKRSPKSHEPSRKELGTMEEYRQLRMRLEKNRHSGVYEGEKRRLYAQMLVKWNCDYEIRLAEDEFETAKLLLTQRLLQENMDHQRRVEELRYKIIRDDPHGMWQRRHEMSLRGRQSNTVGVSGGEGYHGTSQNANSEGDNVGVDAATIERDINPRNNRRRVSIDRARVRVELDAMEVMDDLAEIIGEKRSHGATANDSGEGGRRGPNVRGSGRNNRRAEENDVSRSGATSK